MFILATVLHEIVGVVLAPVGLFFAVMTIILDCFGKISFTEQSIKWFIYSMLCIKFGQLYDIGWLVTAAFIVAVVLMLVFVVRSSQKYEELLDEARKINEL